MSKYFEDLSKLVIAGVVIAAFMKEEISLWWLLGCGGITSMLLMYISWQAFVRSKK